MRGIGAHMAGAGNGQRHENDLYRTPADVTAALLEGGYILRNSKVWEPACGLGDMSDVLKEAGHEVVSTDLFDYGYPGARGGVDFTRRTRSEAEIIITNPPFDQAKQFILAALKMPDVYQFAFLLKATYWNAGNRAELLARHPPTWWLPITWRVDFTGQKNPTMDLCWAVWIRHSAYHGMRPLTRPDRTTTDLFPAPN